MIKEIIFHNWKSFADASLYVDPLTVLIGTNASGKSNAVDGLVFLQRVAAGKDLTAILSGDISGAGIRGGIEWAALKPNSSFCVTTIIVDTSGIEYHYRIEIAVATKRCELLSESLKRTIYRRKTKNNPYEIFLYTTDSVNADDPNINARLYNEKGGTKKAFNRSASILSQLVKQAVRKDITEGVERVVDDLARIFVLDPIPSHMREYVPFSDQLKTDASNTAGIIAGLPGSQKTYVEQTLTKYVSRLPEKDIGKIWAEPVGKFNSDAMLYCEEEWAEGQRASTIDARGMSDGTLRFIAVITAILTRPESSLLVVEEIDNGLHPSRAEVLLEMLKEVGAQRKIDILVTTHNPALLDALGNAMLPFILGVYRDEQTGTSKISPLDEIPNMAKLLAYGSIGKLATDRKIEDALKSSGRRPAKRVVSLKECAS